MVIREKHFSLGNGLFRLLRGPLVIQDPFLFSSRNEFNATRQKRDLLTTEVGYTSERVGNSSPCSARGLCCCDNGAFVRSKATVTEGQWAGAAVPYLLPPAEAHGLTHSFTPGKSSLNYPPRQNSWRTPWEITPPLFCFLWRWTESPRKLLVFDEKHSDNCIRGYCMWGGGSSSSSALGLTTAASRLSHLMPHTAALHRWCLTGIL